MKTMTNIKSASINPTSGFFSSSHSTKQGLYFEHNPTTEVYLTFIRTTTIELSSVELVKSEVLLGVQIKYTAR